MHIDYLTLHVRREHSPSLDWIKIGTLSPILISLKPGGIEEWRTARWTTARSDFAGLSIKALVRGCPGIHGIWLLTGVVIGGRLRAILAIGVRGWPPKQAGCRNRGHALVHGGTATRPVCWLYCCGLNAGVHDS